MTSSGPGSLARTPRLISALVCCAVAALAVTAMALGLVGAALSWLQQGGPATDRMMATLLLGIGVLLLVPPAVLMWVALARLATRPPRGAALMLGCLRAVGGLVLVVALPVLSRTGSVAVIGGVVGIGLALLATAQLLAVASRHP
ncbi:MAG TPA: hypothetical protein VD903_15420 [Pseudonocardia sp.]|jgi:hypothetical protein|nr:hypothetical protein [Pseudonocardia sp.]